MPPMNSMSLQWTESIPETMAIPSGRAPLRSRCSEFSRNTVSGSSVISTGRRKYESGRSLRIPP